MCYEGQSPVYWRQVLLFFSFLMLFPWLVILSPSPRLLTSYFMNSPSSVKPSSHSLPWQEVSIPSKDGNPHPLHGNPHPFPRNPYGPFYSGSRFLAMITYIHNVLHYSMSTITFLGIPSTKYNALGKEADLPNWLCGSLQLASVECEECWRSRGHLSFSLLSPPWNHRCAFERWWHRVHCAQETG